MAETGSENHFAQGGAGYALHRPTYPPQLAEALARECITANHALDVGCGSGQLTTLLAAHFSTVTATDPSASQLAHALTHSRVNYVEGTAEDIHLPDHSVDLVVAAQAAHWFDLAKFYDEVHRVSKIDAIIALISYGVPMLAGTFRERFSQFYWKEIHAFWPDGRKHVESGYQSLTFPFDEYQLPQMSIDRDWHMADLIGYIETWSAVRRARAAGAGATVDQFTEELKENWPLTQTHRICWPINTRIARVATMTA